MNCVHKILVYNVFHRNILVTREKAIDLIKLCTDTTCDKIELDFSNIEFISRSFADQFHKEKISFLENREKEIVIINLNEDALKMLKAVEKITSHENRAKIEYKILHLNDRKSLKNYLLSI